MRRRPGFSPTGHSDTSERDDKIQESEGLRVRSGSGRCAQSDSNREITSSEEAEQNQTITSELPPRDPDGWLKYLVRDLHCSVGHEYLLQEVIQNLLILSQSRAAVLSGDVISGMIQDTQVQNDAFDSSGLSRAGRKRLPN